MARSDALLVCPSSMLRVKPYAGEVVRVRVNVGMPAATIGILTLRDSPLSLAASTIADMFKRRLAGVHAILAAWRFDFKWPVRIDRDAVQHPKNRPLPT